MVVFNLFFLYSFHVKKLITLINVIFGGGVHLDSDKYVMKKYCAFEWGGGMMWYFWGLGKYGQWFFSFFYEASLIL